MRCSSKRIFQFDQQPKHGRTRTYNNCKSNRGSLGKKKQHNNDEITLPNDIHPKMIPIKFRNFICDLTAHQHMITVYIRSRFHVSTQMLVTHGILRRWTSYVQIKSNTHNFTHSRILASKYCRTNYQQQNPRSLHSRKLLL